MLICKDKNGYTIIKKKTLITATVFIPSHEFKTNINNFSFHFLLHIFFISVRTSPFPFYVMEQLKFSFFSALPPQ
jgi:hypothetical protein